LDATQRSLVVGYRRFGTTYRSRLQRSSSRRSWAQKSLDAVCLLLHFQRQITFTPLCINTLCGRNAEFLMLQHLVITGLCWGVGSFGWKSEVTWDHTGSQSWV